MKSISDIQHITCVGSGGVAWSLIAALYEAGYRIEQVCSPHIENAKALASHVNAQAICSADCYRAADLAILAVPDDVVETLLPVFKNKGAMVVHTAGSLPLQTFRNKSIANYGVLYPLQTFTRGQRTDMKNVPIFVEANTTANLQRLTSLAQSISENVASMPSDKRLYLHLAAVFACNFTNHCLSIAADILQSNGINGSVLHPLIQNTIGKALATTHPHSIQTGPALRGDISTLQKHLALLRNDPLRQELYRLVSESIAKSKVD